MRILNFSFPMTINQTDELSAILGAMPRDEICIKANFDLAAPATPQIEAMLADALRGVGPSDQLLVNLPGMSWAAVMVVAGIAGHMGHMPRIMRLVKDAAFFNVREVVDLQAIREGSRIRRWEDAEHQGYRFMKNTIVLNFSHPLSQEALDGIAKNKKTRGEIKVLDIPVQADMLGSFSDQARVLVDAVGLSAEAWQQGSISVNLPGLAPLAATIMAEINGRRGNFPPIIRLNRREDGVFVFAEFLDPQQLRENIRKVQIEKADALKRAEAANWVASPETVAVPRNVLKSLLGIVNFVAQGYSPEAGLSYEEIAALEAANALWRGQKT